MNRTATSIVEKLTEKGLTLCVAESLTGGRLASAIVDVSGASAVFLEGIIAYSNASKIARLNVSHETLESFGAVSAQVAKEMVAGFDCDVALSTTGIAGPLGDTRTKKVGLVYVGLRFFSSVEAFEYNFSGDRNSIQEQTVAAALEKLLNKLEDK